MNVIVKPGAAIVVNNNDKDGHFTCEDEQRPADNCQCAEGGNSGAVGAQGPKGDKGDTGPMGPQGVAGPQGPTGAQGPRGDKGEAGAQGVAGEAGAKGDKGDTGEPGPKGDKGDTGPQGLPGTGTGATLDLSYDEQFTGAYDRTDPDGPRKIYVKTIDCGAVGSTGRKNTPTGIDGVKNYLSISGSILGGDGTGAEKGVGVIPSLNGKLVDNLGIMFWWVGATNTIDIYAGANWATYKVRVTVYYTKVNED